MQLRFVIASSEEKTARGPTLCTFTGVSHSVVGVSHLAAGFPLSPLSHLIRTRRLLRRLLKWRSPPPPLLSTPYLRGKGPGAVLSFPKAETQPSNPESRESRSSNSNSATNYRLSPPLSLHHLLRHISYYYLIIISRARERIIIGRVSRLLFRSGRSIETALIDDRMSVNRSSGSRVDDVSRLEPHGAALAAWKINRVNG